MNPPFSITIEITEATQCYRAVSELLRIFPSLSITITAHERISTTPSTPETATQAADRCRECVAIAAIRDLGFAYRAAHGIHDAHCPCASCCYLRFNSPAAIGSGVASQASVGTNEAGQAVQWAKVSANVAARNAAIDRRDDNADTDDSAYQ